MCKNSWASILKLLNVVEQPELYLFKCKRNKNRMFGEQQIETEHVFLSAIPQKHVEPDLMQQE